MARTTRWRTLPALFLLLLAACGVALPRPAGVGDELPDVSAAALGGATVELRGVAGQAVWVSFWASWCAPCREEWPGMNVAARDLGPAVRIVAVSVNETPETVAAFVAEHPANFAVALDPAGELAARFGVVGFPTHILVTPDGTIRQVVRGPLDGPRAAALLGLPIARSPAPERASRSGGSTMGRSPRVGAARATRAAVGPLATAGSRRPGTDFREHTERCVLFLVS